MPDNDKIITPENQGNITPKSGIPLIKQSKQSVLPSIGSMKRVEQIKNPKLSKKEIEEAAAQAALRDKAEEFSNTTSLNDLLQSVRGNNPYYKDTTDSYTLGFNPYTAFDALGDDATFNIDDNFSQRASDQQSGWQQAKYAIAGGITSGVMRALRALASIPNLIPDYKGEDTEGYRKGSIFNPYNWQFDWEQNALARTLSNASDNIHESMPIYTDPDRPLSMDSSMFWSGTQGIIESAIEFGAIALTTKGLGATASGTLGAAVDAAQLSKIGIIQRIGVGVARTANAASKLTNVFGETAGEFISGLPHGFVANQMEGMVMGLDHYKQRTAELIAAGVPEEEAKKYAANEASDLRLQNTWMMATDVLQMNAIFGRSTRKGIIGGGIRQWAKDFNPTKLSSWLGVTSPITQGFIEGIEEMVQNGIESNITNQSNKEINKIYNAGLKYDVDKGDGLEAIYKYSTTNQAIFEGLMGVFGAGLQNGVARFGNRAASNIRYNKIQNEIKKAETELASLSDSNEDKAKAEIIKKQIKSYKNQLLTTVKGRYQSQKAQIEENNNIIANQMTELFNKMESYSNAFESGDDVTADTIEDNLFSGTVLRNLIAGTDENFISQLEDYAAGKKETESLYGTSTKESREKAGKLAERAREMQAAWDNYSSQSNAEQKFWHQQNILNTSRGIPKITKKVSEIEEKINQKIKERDEAAKRADPNAREFVDLKTLGALKYEGDEEFKEKGERLKELSAKDDLTPEEVIERGMLHKQEKEKHEKEQANKREIFEAEKNEFLKDEELTKARRTLQNLKKIKEDSLKTLKFLNSSQFDVVNNHLDEHFYKNKYNDTDESLNKLEKLVNTRKYINEDGKEFLLNKIKKYRNDVEFKRKIDDVITKQKEFEDKAEERVKEITNKLDSFDENSDLKYSIITEDGSFVQGKVYKVEGENVYLETDNPNSPNIFVSKDSLINGYKKGTVKISTEDFEIYSKDKEALKVVLSEKVKDIQELIDIWKLEDVRLDGKISEHESIMAKIESLLANNIKVSNDFIAELVLAGFGKYIKWPGGESIDTFDGLVLHMQRLNVDAVYDVAKIISDAQEEIDSLRDYDPETHNLPLKELKEKLENELSKLYQAIETADTTELENQIFNSITKKIENRLKILDIRIKKATEQNDDRIFEIGVKAAAEKEELLKYMDDIVNQVNKKVQKEVNSRRLKKETYRAGKKQILKDKIADLEKQIENNNVNADKDLLLRIRNAKEIKERVENDIDNLQDLHDTIIHIKRKLESFKRIKEDVQKRLTYYQSLQNDNTFTEVTNEAISERIDNLRGKLKTINKLINKLEDVIKKAYQFIKDAIKSFETHEVTLRDFNFEDESQDYSRKELETDGEYDVSFGPRKKYNKYRNKFEALKKAVIDAIDAKLKAEENYKSVQEKEVKRNEELRKVAMNLQDNIRYLEDMLIFESKIAERERAEAEEEIAEKNDGQESEESGELILNETEEAILHLLESIENKILNSDEYKKDPNKFERLLNEVSKTKQSIKYVNFDTIEQALDNIKNLLNENFEDEAEEINNIRKSFKEKERSGKPVYNDSVQKVSYKSNPKKPSVFKDGQWIEELDGTEEVHPLELNEGGLTDYNITIDAREPKLGNKKDSLYGEIIIEFSDGTKALVHTSSWNLATNGDEFVKQEGYESDGESKTYYKFKEKSPIYLVLKDTKKSKKEKAKEIAKIIQQQGEGIKFLNVPKFASEEVSDYYERVANETIDTYDHRQNLILNGKKDLIHSKITSISKGSLRESALKPSDSVLDSSYDIKLGLTNKQEDEKSNEPNGIYVKIPVKSDINGKPRFTEVLLQPRLISDDDYLIAATAALDWLRQGDDTNPQDAMMALVRYLPILTHKEGGLIDFDITTDGKRKVKISNKSFTESLPNEEDNNFLQLFSETLKKSVEDGKLKEINIKLINQNLIDDNKNSPIYSIKDGKIQLVPVKDYILSNTETFLQPTVHKETGVKYFHIQPIYEYEIKNKEEVSKTKHQEDSLQFLNDLSEIYQEFTPNNQTYKNDTTGAELIRVSNYIGKEFDESKYPESLTAGNYVDAVGRYYFDNTTHSYEDFVKEFGKSRNYLDDVKEKGSESKSKYLQFIDGTQNSEVIFENLLSKFKNIEDKIRKIPGLSDCTIFSKEILLSYYFGEEKELNGIKSIGIGGSTDLVAVDKDGNYHIFDIKSTRISDRYNLENKIYSNSSRWKAQQDLYSDMLERATGKKVTTNIIAIGVTYEPKGDIPSNFKSADFEVFNIERDFGIKKEDLIKNGEEKPLIKYEVVEMMGKKVIYTGGEDVEFEGQEIQEENGKFYTKNSTTGDKIYGEIVGDDWLFSTQNTVISSNNDANDINKNESKPLTETSDDFDDIPFSIKIDADAINTQASEVIASWDGSSIPFELQTAIVDKVFIVAMAKIHGRYQKEEAERDEEKLKESIFKILESDIYNTKDVSEDLLNLEQYYDVIWNQAKVKLQSTGISLRSKAQKITPDLGQKILDDEETGEDGGPSEKFGTEIFEIDDFDTVSHIVKAAIAMTPKAYPNADGKPEFTKNKQTGYIEFLDVENTVRALRRILSGIPNLTFEKKGMINTSVEELLKKEAKRSGKSYYLGLFEYMKRWDAATKNALVSNFKNVKNNFKTVYWDVKNGKLTSTNIDSIRDNGAGVLVQQWNSHFLNDKNGFVKRSSSYRLYTTGKSREIYDKWKEIQAKFFKDKDRESAINNLLPLLYDMGIDINKDDLEFIFTKPRDYSEVAQGRREHFTAMNDTSPFGKLFTWMKNVDEGDYISNGNPFKINENYFKELATFLSSRSDNEYSESYRAKDGSTRFAYTTFDLMTKVSTALKNGTFNELYGDLLGAFGKSQNYSSDSAFNFSIITETSKKGESDSVSISDMTQLEREAAILSLLFNGGSNTRHIISPTNSDKGRIFAISMTNTFQGTHKKNTIDRSIEPLLRGVGAESSRMAAKSGDTGDARFEEGHKFYYTMPQINYAVAKKLITDKLKSLWSYKNLQNGIEDFIVAYDESKIPSPEALNSPGIAEFFLMAGGLPEDAENTQLEDLVDLIMSVNYDSFNKCMIVNNNNHFVSFMAADVFNKNVEAIKNDWEKLGIATLKEGKSNILIDNKWIELNGFKHPKNKNSDSFEDDVKKYHERVLDAAAREYLYLTRDSNLSYYQTIAGDPAISFKKSEKYDKNMSVDEMSAIDVLKTIATTNKEIIKRNAKNLASGKLLNFNIWDGEKFFDQKEYTVTVLKDDERKSAIKELHKIKQYTNMNVADAYELTTGTEFLNVEWANNGDGSLTEEMYKRIYDKIKYQDSLKWYEDVPNKYLLTDEELLVVNGAQKPVQVSPIKYENNHDLTGRFYGKSAAFPLIHQLIKGTELAKLKEALNRQGIDRALFESAVKNGAMRPTTVWENGKFNEIENLHPIKLSRDGFYIQNEIPYNPTKKEILLVSQMDKLITDHFATNHPEYKQKKAEIRIAMFNAAKRDLMKSLDIEEMKNADGNKIYVLNNKSKIIDILRSEVIKRGFSVNDISSLDVDDWGNLKIPLFFNPIANKLESVLTSYLSKILKQKVHGQSYVQASAIGIVTIEDYEDKNKKGGIIRIPTYDKDGNKVKRDATPRFIRSEDGKVEAAEVYVPWKFLKGNEIVEISKYIDKDGDLDISKIDPKLLQLITARIPNQGHSSMLPVKIIGFLPSNRNTIIVPLEIVGQMGSDFDVDKLYAYMWNYKVFKNGDIVLHDSNKHKRAQIAKGIVAEAKEELNTLKKKRDEIIKEHLLDSDEKFKDLLETEKTLREEYDKANKESSDEEDDLKTLIEKNREIKKINQEIKDYIQSKADEIKDKLPESELFDIIEAIDNADYSIDLAIKEAYKEEGIEEGNEDLSKLDLKTLQNKYFDLHWDILTHPEMLDIVSKPLDLDDLKEQAREIENNKDPFASELSITDPSYNTNAYFENRSGKEGVAIESLALTLNAILQNGGEFTIRAGSLPMEFILSNGEKLTNLGIDSESYYKGEKRSITDNIKNIQNEAVDNAKNGNLGVLNFNKNTFNAINALLMLSTKNGESLSNEYTVALITHPAILNYIEKREYEFNIYNNKYSRSKDNELRVSLGAIKTNQIKVPSIKDIKSGKVSDQEVLNLFFAMDELGQQLSILNKAIDASTKGLGKSFLESKLKSLLYEDMVINGDSKSLFYNISINGLEQLRNTEYGYAVEDIVLFSNSIVEHLYPYGKMIDTLYNYFKAQGLDIKEEDWRTLFNEYKSYVFSNKYFYDKNASEERERLLNGNDNIFDRFEEIKNDLERENIGDYLFRSLYIETVNEEKVLKYPAARTERLDAHYGTLSLLQLLNSPVDKYREFAKDFITYTYLTNANQNASNFIKYMPYSVLVSIGQDLSNEQRLLENGFIDYNSFLPQLVQHNLKFAASSYALSPNDFKNIPSKEDILYNLEKYKKAPESKEKQAVLKKLNGYLELYTDTKINLFNVNTNDGSIKPFVKIKINEDGDDHYIIYKIVKTDKGFKGIPLKDKSQSFYKDYNYNANFAQSIAIEQDRDTSFAKKIEDNFGLKDGQEVKGDIAFNEILENGNDVQVQMVKILDEIKNRPNIVINTKLDIPGGYKGNAIHVNPLKPGVSFSMDATEDFMYTLIHERTHHILYDKIKSGELTEKGKEIVKNLNGLRNQAISMLNIDEQKEFISFCKLYPELVDKETNNKIKKIEESHGKIAPASVVTNELKSKYYGLLNIHEFVAMAWSDPMFQKSLNKKSKTVFDKIVASIKALLKEIEKQITGIDEESILAQTLDQSVKLMKEISNESVDNFQTNNTSVVNEILENMLSSTAKDYTNNAVAKAYISTQAIADSTLGTTSIVKNAFGNKANTGVYSDSDIVMFSANGRRNNRVPVIEKNNGVITLTDEYENIQKAVNAGAHIVNDTDQHLADPGTKYGNFNSGELEFEEWMRNNAKNYEKVHVTIKVNDNNIKIGYWKPIKDNVKIDEKTINIKYVTPETTSNKKSTKTRKTKITTRKRKTPVKVEGINFLNSKDEFVKELIPMYNNVSFKYKGKKYENLIHAFETWKSGEFNEQVYNLGVGRTSNSTLSLFTFDNEENQEKSKEILKELIYERMKQNTNLIDGITERGGVEFLEKSSFKVDSDDTLINNFLDLTVDAYNELENNTKPNSTKSNKLNTKKQEKITNIKEIEDLDEDVRNELRNRPIEQNQYTGKGIVKSRSASGVTLKPEKRVFYKKGSVKRKSAIDSIIAGDRTRMSVPYSVVKSIKERAKDQDIKKGIVGTILYLQDKDGNSPTYGKGAWIRVTSEFFVPTGTGFNKEGMTNTGNKGKNMNYKKAWDFHKKEFDKLTSFDFEFLQEDNDNLTKKTNTTKKTNKTNNDGWVSNRELLNQLKELKSVIDKDEINKVNNMLNDLSPNSISIQKPSEFFLPQVVIRKLNNIGIKTGIKNTGKYIEVYVNNASDGIINIITSNYTDRGVIDFNVSNLFDNNYVIKIPLSKVNIDNINNPDESIDNLELNFNFEAC